MSPAPSARHERVSSMYPEAVTPTAGTGQTRYLAMVTALRSGASTAGVA